LFGFASLSSWVVVVLLLLVLLRVLLLLLLLLLLLGGAAADVVSILTLFSPALHPPDPRPLLRPSPHTD
jgi:hypothetical protein